MRSSRFISHIISTVFLTVVYVFSLSEGLFLSILSIGEVSAVYTESSDDTYGFYKKKLESALQDMERDFKVNGSITDGNISSVRSLINEAYIRLPDTPDDASKNENMKKSVDLYLDLAAKNKSSQTQVSNAIQQAGRFITEASIGQIAGSISANPAEGNAPLTTSFLASAKDPSGVNIIDSNYIWWTRENGGYRKEL